ncbi:MAG TPA: methyltransferase domain-containing protein [Pyrinomonadaceae bacterium]|nr:methyltransferase domain-containing protein [Pyrinomonadaceae bacterium]
MSDWDERYRRGDYATQEPSQLLVRAVAEFAAELFTKDESPRAKTGATRAEVDSTSASDDAPRALDIACGAGRHAVYLAARGFRVTAVDSSRVGVELMRERARAAGLRLDARVADLERGEFEIEAGAYALVCDFYYLQRDLFAAMRAGVKRGGLFVAAIHMTDERPGVRPMNPGFLLRAGELREQFQDWQILHYHESVGRDEDPGQHTRRSAEVIARRRA